MTVDDALMNIQEIEAALLNDYRDKFYDFSARKLIRFSVKMNCVLIPNKQYIA